VAVGPRLSQSWAISYHITTGTGVGPGDGNRAGSGGGQAKGYLVDLVKGCGESKAASGMQTGNWTGTGLGSGMEMGAAAASESEWARRARSPKFGAAGEESRTDSGWGAA